MMIRNEIIPNAHGVEGLFVQQKAVDDATLVAVTDFLTNTTDWFPLSAAKNSRHVIHYGRKYNYSRGSSGAEAPPMPAPIAQLRDILARVCAEVGLDVIPFVQCIINKYLPGQGIGEHTDSRDYGPVIGCFTFNLGAPETSPGEMDFIINGGETPVPTPHASLYIMSGLARMNYRHQMVARKKDTIAGVPTLRGVRVSVTFRSIATL